ncbi:MAG: hypothetical protein EP297_14435 [Gammaproteobacteria bacterium]|nr:MAG: hypothetical protein EP297_14435 [Gammaproteobacteria bacterium]
MRQHTNINNHRQQGTIEVTGIYWAIVLIIGYLVYGQVDSIIFIIVYAIAALWFGSVIGALPFADDWTRESTVKKAAEKFGGKFNKFEEKVFGGGTAWSYSTNWEDESCRFKLYASVGGLTLSASKKGVDFPSASVKCIGDELNFTDDDENFLKQALGDDGKAMLISISKRYKAEPYLFTRDNNVGLILSRNFSVSRAIELIDLFIPIMKGILVSEDTE